MVIKPLTVPELKNFFDTTSLKVINYFLNKSIISQPELMVNQSDLPINIPKEHIEQWVCQAIKGAEPKGAGSYPVDVIAKKKWAADVKMLSCKVNNNSLTNADSGETSLAQKFGDNNFGKSNNTLDELFKKKQYKTIWSDWKIILKNKYKQVKNDLGINDIYFFFILRAGVNFHLCGMKVDLNYLEQTSENIERSTQNSLWIKGYINDNYGHVKIYKAKKRLELRLKPKHWVDTKKVLTFKTNFKRLDANIRSLIKDGKLDKHIEENLIPILKNLN